ncbi:MAG: uroporphyrinogen decarboxylase family protein [Planctomycetota bacterium]
MRPESRSRTRHDDEDEDDKERGDPMNPKENALRIVRFDSPERIASGMPTHDISYFGVNHEPFEGEGGHGSPVGTQWRDIWGVGWRKEMEGVMGYAVHHPLADLDVERYGWPDPDDERLVKQVYERARDPEFNPEEQFVRGSHRETLWERAYNLVGMDRLMMAFFDAPDAVREIFRRITDFQLGIARHYAKCGIEIASTGGDLGTQVGLLVGPEIMHEFMVPEWKRLIAFYSERGVLIGRHCCGHVEPILDMFMELGIDVLNPIQATANDLARVRGATAGKMALAGGVSTGIVMDGPPERIRAEARRCMWLLGREGGYFCSPDQGMPFPEEHIAALREEVESYGVYPLKPPEEIRESPAA